MGKTSVSSGSLFLMSEEWEMIPIGNTIDADMIENSIEECSVGVQDIDQRCPSYEISFTLDYYNKKKFIEALFGITNNYRRMHGGFALRERSKYRWHKRHKGVKRK